MLVSDFDFVLPPELIAQEPPAVRGESRMLLVDRHTGAWQDRRFPELPELLAPGDLLVLNDTRVLPARLFGRRGGLHTQAGTPRPSGHVEVLLTEQLEGPARWRALVRPAKKVAVGEELLFAVTREAEPLLRAIVEAEGAFGERILRFSPSEAFYSTLDRLGSLPLPPYIRRERTAPNTAADRERYQTVYAQPGEGRSAAAPTAGLHFTPEVLQRLLDQGVEIAYITLHVGLGTFQPVRVEHTEEIRLHAEPYTLGPATAEALNKAWAAGRRIVAVGTTTTRTLEHMARRFEQRYGVLSATNPLALEPHAGTTSLFLSPGPDGDHRFRLVRGLLTNFHLPESTLLMLVSAFAGRDHVLAAYTHAVAERYRFFSYGDCMLLL